MEVEETTTEEKV